jgi:hypothetical protein
MKTRTISESAVRCSEELFGEGNIRIHIYHSFGR